MTKARTSLKPINGKEKKIKQQTSKAFSIPSTYGKIKKKEKVNTKKAKCFSCENVGHFKRIARPAYLKRVKLVSVIFCTLKIVWWKNLKTLGFFILDSLTMFVFLCGN